jgi:hypothetical protein
MNKYVGLYVRCTADGRRSGRGGRDLCNRPPTPIRGTGIGIASVSSTGARHETSAPSIFAPVSAGHSSYRPFGHTVRPRCLVSDRALFSANNITTSAASSARQTSSKITINGAAALGPGCVKTSVFNNCRELFSTLCLRDASWERCYFSHLRNRGQYSTF